MTAAVRIGDCLEIMPTMDAESVDAVITDPPYGLGFMGKDWDTFAPESVERNKLRDTRSQKRRGLYAGKESDAPSAAMAAARYDGRRDDEFEAFMFAAAVEMLRVAKPGAHLVIFGSTRRHHRLMCGVEDAGWEIRDTLSYLFGSGFPKSRNVGGGWGTALKPAWDLAAAPSPHLLWVKGTWYEVQGGRVLWRKEQWHYQFTLDARTQQARIANLGVKALRAEFAR